MRNDFNTHITDWLGAAVTMGDFDTSDLIPECVYFDNPDIATHKGSPYEILPTPEPGDNYVNVEIMLIREDEM